MNDPLQQKVENKFYFPDCILLQQNGKYIIWYYGNKATEQHPLPTVNVMQTIH